LALFLRYRQGTRIDVEANPFEDLRSFLGAVGDEGRSLQVLNERIREELWDLPRPDVRSTWFALLREYFRIHRDEVQDRTGQVQLLVLRVLAQGGSPAEIWGRVLWVMVEHLDELSAWRSSNAASMAAHCQVERAEDGTYYVERDGQRAEILGARTHEETKLEYILEDCSRKYAHVGRICRLVALFCLYQHFQQNRGSYPLTIRVTLPEDAYLHWSWYHLTPIGTPRVPWRPPDRHSDPESLAIDVATSYTERNPMHFPQTAPAERVPQQDFPRQYEQAMETDLRLGDDVEAIITYGGRELRWVNGRRTIYPVLIMGTRDHEAREERRLVAEFLSVLCFDADMPITPVMSVICPRRAAPMVHQPRKLADHIYPAKMRPDVGRPLTDARRLALALYREGRSSGSSYYEFLNLYKVLQIRLPGAGVAEWINPHVDDNVPSVTRIRELRQEGVADITYYLYENWRNAITQVGREPHVNPDDLETAMRIGRDLPIVRDLARTMIRSELLD
jgi:hypothetical protein